MASRAFLQLAPEGIEACVAPLRLRVDAGLEGGALRLAEAGGRTIELADIRRLGDLESAARDHDRGD